MRWMESSNTESFTWIKSLISPNDSPPYLENQYQLDLIIHPLSKYQKHEKFWYSTVHTFTSLNFTFSFDTSYQNPSWGSSQWRFYWSSCIVVPRWVVTLQTVLVLLHLQTWQNHSADIDVQIIITFDTKITPLFYTIFETRILVQPKPYCGRLTLHETFLKNNLEDISPFCGATDTLIFDFWWCPPLGFKTRVGSLIYAWHKCMCYTFSKIHLWCNTSSPLGSQHGSQAIVFHGGHWLGLKLGSIMLQTNTLLTELSRFR